MPDGGWSTEGGHLQRVLNSPEYAPLYAGGDEQSDYIVSYQFKVTNSQVAHVGFHLMMNNPVDPQIGNTDCYSFIYYPVQPNGDAYAGFRINRYDGGGAHLMATRSMWFTWDLQYVKIGVTASRIMYKHWVEGQNEPDWEMSLYENTYHSGYWMPTVQAGWIDNFQVEGYGTVPTEQSSWGGVKALYR